MTIKMSHLAQHDSLTDLPNRVLLTDRLTQAISLARRTSEQLVLLFLDLDHFKNINDSLGHAIGDKLLQSVAQRLVACARHSDTVSRQGGDEFVVLLPQIGRAADAAVLAQKMITALAAPHTIAGNELRINASIGISRYPNDGQDAESLLKSADTAMYYAKKKGRNNFQFFKADMATRAAARQSLEGLLGRALSDTSLCCITSQRSIFRPERLPELRRSYAGCSRIGGLFLPYNSCPSPKSPA